MQNALYLSALLQGCAATIQAGSAPPEAFFAATMGGARALGRERELGAITVGRVADLVGYRLDAIPFAPLNNAVNQLVYAASRAEVDLVLVDGEVIEQGGKLTRIDEAAIIAEIREAHARIEPQLSASEADVERISPITSASIGAASAWRSRPTPIPPVSATDCVRKHHDPTRGFPRARHRGTARRQ